MWTSMQQPARTLRAEGIANGVTGVFARPFRRAAILQNEAIALRTSQSAQ
jgi:hypothetical protein